jgi:hypothetical protein
MPIVNMLQYWILFLNLQVKPSLTLVAKTTIMRQVGDNGEDTLGHFFGYIHNKMNQTQFLGPFQKSKDLKLEIEMICNHCTKFMV